MTGLLALGLFLLFALAIWLAGNEVKRQMEREDEADQ